MSRASRQAQVNLARRPFVNRRPIARLAVLLWLLGSALLVVNVKLYAGHWRGKAMNNQRLAEVNRELAAQSRELSALDRELGRVNLRRQNQKTRFLNSLISHRTFPWSALFEDLEEVLPSAVRLLSVKPSVQLAAEPEKSRRQRRGSSPANAAAEGGATAAAAQAPLQRDEVTLGLTAVAENEDAMYELINRLYTSSSFRDPFIPGEVRNLDSGSTSFSISVIYLTRREPPVEATPAVEEGTETGGPPDEIVVVSPQDEEAGAAAGAPARPEEPEVAEAEPDDRPAETRRPAAGPAAAAPDPTSTTSRPSSAGRRATGRPAAGRATAGRPTAGSSAAGVPTVGVPAPGRPAPGSAVGGRSPARRPSAGSAAATSRPGTRRPGREDRGEAPGVSRPAPEEPAEGGEPPFAERPASATPGVRNGSLLPDPFDPWAAPRFGTGLREVAA